MSAKKVEEVKVEEVKAEEAKVEEAKVEETEKVQLKVLIPFTDKFTNQDYKLNEVINVDKDRAKELLKDFRKLVSKEN